MTDKIGCFIVDLEGQTLTPEERDILSHPLVGGVVLFTRNFASRDQLSQLCRSIRAASSHPLLIMVDQEGGRVQRFIKDFTRLPPMGHFSRAYDTNATNAQKLAKDCGWLMALELLAAGVDLSLAPVLDLNKGKNSVIGNRAFHASPQAVIDLTHAFMVGMKEAGMAATGKHFPGHGHVTVDSHLALPVDERSLADIEREDLIPFAGLIQKGIAAIMAAHIIYPQVDNLPVGFSKRWLQAILRERLGFQGVIISDDLNMEGANISSNYVDRVAASKNAGCDLVLLCNNRRGVIEVLDHLPYEKYLISKEKWGGLQGDFLSQHQAYANLPRWQETHDLLLSEGQNGS